MKLISWNVNGLRAIYKKGFIDIFKSLDADIFCIQETKMQEGQIELDLERILRILQLCRKERLFRNSNIHKKRAFKC